MGWDRKKRGATRGYYYRSVRDGDRTRKIYLGKCAAAEEAAEAVTRRRNNETRERLLSEKKPSPQTRPIAARQSFVSGPG